MFNQIEAKVKYLINQLTNKKKLLKELDKLKFNNTNIQVKQEMKLYI